MFHTNIFVPSESTGPLAIFREAKKLARAYESETMVIPIIYPTEINDYFLRYCTIIYLN
jgi:hypothetical protein